MGDAMCTNEQKKRNLYRYIAKGFKYECDLSPFKDIKQLK